MSKVILKTNSEFIRIVSRLPDTAKIYCSSFNISAWESHGPSHSILHELNIRDSHLVIGVPYFRSCTGDSGRGRCKSCYNKHSKALKSLATLRDTYANIDWKFVTNLHAKFLTAGSLTITGGRNISDGKMADLSFAENDAKLAKQLRTIWEEYASKAYDIGTSGPLVFTSGYKGEVLADSTWIADEYKKEVARTQPDGTEGRYWSK